MDIYNSLIPTITKISKETEIPEKTLATIVLTETRGKGGERFEQDFQKRYIEDKFEKDKNEDLIKNRYTSLYLELRKTNPALTIDEFKKQLSTSYGPAQVMGATAVDLGYRGDLTKLNDSELNISLAAKLVKREFGKEENPDLDEILRFYNTGARKFDTDKKDPAK